MKPFIPHILLFPSQVISDSASDQIQFQPQANILDASSAAEHESDGANEEKKQCGDQEK